MTANLWVSLIVGIAGPLATILVVLLSNKKNEQKQNQSDGKINKKVDEYKEVTLYRIDQLEKKQDIHNGIIERVYVGEGNILELQHDIRDVKNRLDNIQRQIDNIKDCK